LGCPRERNKEDPLLLFWVPAERTQERERACCLWEKQEENFLLLLHLRRTEREMHRKERRELSFFVATETERKRGRFKRVFERGGFFSAVIGGEERA